MMTANEARFDAVRAVLSCSGGACRCDDTIERAQIIAAIEAVRRAVDPACLCIDAQVISDMPRNCAAHVELAALEARLAEIGGAE